MFAPLKSAADFRRLLATRPRGRSAHFVLYHLSAVPSRPKATLPEPADRNLSTLDAQKSDAAVDKLSGEILSGLSRRQFETSVPGAESRWLGCVIPKRQARRAVTRNLLRRQMREAVRRRGPLLDPGLWLLRLRAGFDARGFPSASSGALREAAREELDQLLAGVKSLKGAAR